MMTYVLIHGSWCSGSVWSRVADLLTEMGHGVEVVPQLPSTGTDADTLGDLHDDVAHVRSLLDGIPDDVVLVGHSYGGMIVTELADHPSVRHSVYVAGFWPLAGQTTLDARGGGSLPDWLIMREDGATQVSTDAAAFRAAFCADLSKADAGQLHRELVLQPPTAFGVAATAPVRTHPVTYVVTEQDQSFAVAVQEQSARRADHVVRVAAAHMAQVSVPEEIAQILAATVEDSENGRNRQRLALGAMSGAAGESFRVGMLVFDGMTHLDTVGPADMFARVPGLKIVTIGLGPEPVTTDSGTRILPDVTVADAPELDLLFVGGGPGTTDLLDDGTVLEFVRTRGRTAKWVTSVCTGALVLGAAGLLDGYEAATHWTVMHLLPVLGAKPIEARVVIDRNRITGGGVTAGIDFALTVIATLWGEELAQLIQLGSEYNPQPPFRTGSPQTAPPELVARFRAISAELTEARRVATDRAATRLRG